MTICKDLKTLTIFRCLALTFIRGFHSKIYTLFTLQYSNINDKVVLDFFISSS
jgi:hypothetical protein